MTCLWEIALAGLQHGFMNLGLETQGLLSTLQQYVSRFRDPGRRRPFRVPAIWLVAPLTILGCLFLFLNLPTEALVGLPLWTGVGLLIYFLYGYRRSHLGRGLIEVHEPEIHDIDPSIPGVDERDPLDPPRRPPGL